MVMMYCYNALLIFLMGIVVPVNPSSGGGGGTHSYVWYFSALKKQALYQGPEKKIFIFLTLEYSIQRFIGQNTPVKNLCPCI